MQNWSTGLYLRCGWYIWHCMMNGIICFPFMTSNNIFTSQAIFYLLWGKIMLHCKKYIIPYILHLHQYDFVYTLRHHIISKIFQLFIFVFLFLNEMSSWIRLTNHALKTYVHTYVESTPTFLCFCHKSFVTKYNPLTLDGNPFSLSTSA